VSVYKSAMANDVSCASIGVHSYIELIVVPDEAVLNEQEIRPTKPARGGPRFIPPRSAIVVTRVSKQVSIPPEMKLAVIKHRTDGRLRSDVAIQMVKLAVIDTGRTMVCVVPENLDHGIWRRGSRRPAAVPKFNSSHSIDPASGRVYAQTEPRSLHGVPDNRSAYPIALERDRLGNRHGP
jgi:hypothetical protein